MASDGKGAEAVRPWLEAARPAHPSLLDSDLAVAELYQVHNVPAAFWIDESGVIVRANDPIYAQRPNPEGGPAVRSLAYLDALRDWAARGAESRFLQEAARIEARRGPVSFEDVEAAASFRLGVFLAQAGLVDSARPHLERASELSRSNWTYRRQAWSFLEADRDTILAGIRDPDAPAFYPPLEIEPGP